MEIDDKALQELYAWVDQIPLSRIKRNISRDFSDGVLLAEIIHHFIPKLVSLHNYSQANSVSQKVYNWKTLSRKVLTPLNILLTNTDISEIVLAKPLKIESVLLILKGKIEGYHQDKERRQQEAHDFALLTQNNNKDDCSQTKRIDDLENTIKLLELKIHKMKQLLDIKDLKLKSYENKLKISNNHY